MMMPQMPCPIAASQDQWGSRIGYHSKLVQQSNLTLGWIALVEELYDTPALLSHLSFTDRYEGEDFINDDDFPRRQVAWTNKTTQATMSPTETNWIKPYLRRTGGI